MTWTYTETHTRTLKTRTCTHILYTHGHAYNSCAHTRVGRCVFTVCFPSTRLHKHTVQIDVRANARTLLLDLSLSHSHTHTLAVIHYYMSILWTSLHWTSPYTFSSGLFFPLSSSSFLFFWQTDDEEWLKMEMCDTFPYKATQFLKPTSVFFSPSRHRGARRRRKKGLQPTKKCLGMTQGPKKPAS